MSNPPAGLLDSVAAFTPRKLNRNVALRAGKGHACLPGFLPFDGRKNRCGICASRRRTRLLLATFGSGSEFDHKRLAGLKSRTVKDNACIVWSGHFNRQSAFTRHLFKRSRRRT